MQCSKQPGNLGAFGQVLGSLADYNLASADEDDLSVLRSIAPSHHRYIVEIDPNGCALRSVHFTHDAIAAPLPYWIYPALIQIVYCAREVRSAEKPHPF